MTPASHILAVTGAETTLRMKYDDKVALTQPLPAAAQPRLSLCASETATHSFKIEAVPAEPFTTAAIECPRTPAEGGARSGPDDAKKTGKERVRAHARRPGQGGLQDVVSTEGYARGSNLHHHFAQRRGLLQLVGRELLLGREADCGLDDPAGKQMPVPDPDSKLRIEYCPPKAGEYKLLLSSSTGDYYATASVDCSRFGAEGLKRLKER
jgi:hypothetical protein